MKRALVLALALLLLPIAAHAQVVAAPTLVTFNLGPETLTAVQLDFFQCASIAGSGASATAVGCATTPFQGDITIPIAQVQTIPADAFGNTRQVALNAAPVAGTLAAVPIGVPFMATISAVGDPATGAGVSPRSAASNPFFSSLKPVAPPTGPHLK